MTSISKERCVLCENTSTACNQLIPSGSRNQLTFLPPALCALPLLEVLIVAYNKLVSLPEEIGKGG